MRLATTTPVVWYAWIDASSVTNTSHTFIAALRARTIEHASALAHMLADGFGWRVKRIADTLETPHEG